MTLNLIGLTAFVLVMILFIVFLVALTYVTNSLNKRKYLKHINETFQKQGFIVIDIKSTKEVEEANSDASFGALLMNSGVSAMHTFYKRVNYLDEFHNQKSCTVAIKKFLFVIVSIEYKFDG